MSKPVDRMRVLMTSLPEKDIPLGHKFLDIRDFDSLKELVDSAVYKVKKGLKNEALKDKYANINFECLRRLKSEVDTYIELLGDSFEDSYSELECELDEVEVY